MRRIKNGNNKNFFLILQKRVVPIQSPKHIYFSKKMIVFSNFT